MKIPSSRVLRDMEAAAELRAAGATWDTIGQQLKRLSSVVLRWVAGYREEWERMLGEAERRAGRHADNESRTMLRKLLRHKDPRVRLGAADQLAKRRLAELAVAPPPQTRADLTTLFDEVEGMSHEELERLISGFIERTSGAGNVANAGAAEAPPGTVPGPAAPAIVAFDVDVAGGAARSG